MVSSAQRHSLSWPREFLATLVLAWPLVIAQIAQNAIIATDVLMMGWLGPQFLAAGTLSHSFYTPFLLLGGGIASAVAPLVAQALGARKIKNVRRTARQGFWAAIAVATVLLPILWNIRPILLVLGQDPALARLCEGYMRIAAFALYPALGIFVLRSFLSALGKTSVILWSTVAGIGLNALGNYALMFGNFGLPALELRGAGITTVFANSAMFAMLLAYALTHKRLRRFHILVRFWKPDWPRFWEILRIGTPIGLTIMAEVGMFSMTTILIGWLGTAPLAAHAVALQLSSLTFMVPLGIGQATTIRVGRAYGAASGQGIERAGWSSYAIVMGFMAVPCALFIFAPEPLIGLFLDPADPSNRAAIQLGAGYLLVAALFQFVDGAQVIGAHALRGLSDTKIPMIIAFVGYWVIGIPASYVFGFVLDLEGVGVWLGLAAGLAFAALFMTWRFARRDTLGLVAPPAIAVARA